MTKRPWCEGPWTAQFRHIVSYTSDKDHPLRYWPDCTGEFGEGEWQCETEGCEFAEDCKGEWEDCSVQASIAYLKNPGTMTQGDQVVHHMVDANARLMALAPQMAEIILTLHENDVQVGDSEEVVVELNKIIAQEERHQAWLRKKNEKHHG